MLKNKDYYEVLGISKKADAGEIKKAYRNLAKKYHPDTNKGNAAAEQKFKEITEAYNILSDPQKKKEYDQFGQSPFESTDQPFNGQFYRKTYSSSDDVNDIFGDIFGNMFGGGKYRSNFDDFQNGQFQYRYETDMRQRGKDLHSEITITFDEAIHGCEKIIRLQNTNGTSTNPNISLQVHIPAGIDNGKSIRLKGKGLSGVNGGENGDLLLKINVMNKSGFERKEQDVYSTIKVPFTKLALGGETKVTTVDGDVICKIQKGTQSGTKIRLKGKGVPLMENPQVKGDHYVTIEAEVPRNLTPEVERILRELEKTTLMK